MAGLTAPVGLASPGYRGDHGGDPKASAGAVGPLQQPNRLPIPGLKPKDLIGVPWRIALALQADGWYLRSDIIWHKPNVMPVSVKDRVTPAHEYLFLLARSERYYYDHKAIVEPASPDSHARYSRGRRAKHKWTNGPGGQTIATSFEHMRKPGVNPKAEAAAAGSRQNASFSAAVKDVVDFRNRRSVWTVPNRGYRGAHFATFPAELVRPCILAGCPKGGTVLDPFGGSGTVGAVALEEDRSAVLIDVNPEYVELQRERCGTSALSVVG